jgi:phosphoribosylformimino-5-aminoimidazole carboxamide ribotide isomerase
MKFRPCIDLHHGKVKQIVGSTLTQTDQPKVNFTSEHPAGWYASKYASDHLTGGHIIQLGTGNDVAACEALTAYPGGLQIGGGITAENASSWLARGAAKVIVTSWLFENGQISAQRLAQLVDIVESDRLVIDLSCRKHEDRYYVVTDRWQTFTDTLVERETLHRLADSCAEFLIHAVDVEGKQAGIDQSLLELLAEHSPIPCVYAGGVSSFEDLQNIRQYGAEKIDVTVGSALDLFGGSLSYTDVINFCD